MLHKPKEKHQSLDSKKKKRKIITFQVDAPKITIRKRSIRKEKNLEFMGSNL